ncbi:MAG: 50S ribosomal protein L24 [Candidatus Pacebacteria bacterium CG_4_10_14_0_8_um_filter_42_14]|nr:MAG: 50S ribosomal protein L24 [Candidatus Pacebacteria bacterium CG_4_10_14_0_8_um_filter_42_14]
MKFKVGDNIRVTAGKDKGKVGSIASVIPSKNKVVIAGVNVYAKHKKPQQGQAGEIVRRERPLPVSNIAILNEKGELDRIGYELTKDGQKTRIFKKSGGVVPEPKIEKKKSK